MVMSKNCLMSTNPKSEHYKVEKRLECQQPSEGQCVWQTCVYVICFPTLTFPRVCLCIISSPRNISTCQSTGEVVIAILVHTLPFPVGSKWRSSYFIGSATSQFGSTLYTILNVLAMIKKQKMSPCHAMVAQKKDIWDFSFLTSYERMYQSLRENENKMTVDGQNQRRSSVPPFKSQFTMLLESGIHKLAG